MLIPAVNNTRPTLIDINTIHPAILLIVSFKILSKSLILFFRGIFLNLYNDESPHRRNTIFIILCCPFQRQALKSITLVGCVKLLNKVIRLLIQVAASVA